MASIVGHTLAGVITERAARVDLAPRKRNLLLAVLVTLALLPDADVLIYIVAEPAGMTPHRGFSHSLTFALLAAALVALTGARYFELRRARLFAFAFAAVLSHLVLDFAMGAGPRLPLFAPLSWAGFISPVTLIPWAYYATSAKGLLGVLLMPQALLGFYLELVMFAPLALALGAPHSRRRWLLLATSAAGALCTVLIYN